MKAEVVVSEVAVQNKYVMLILVATDEEYNLAKQYLPEPDYHVKKTGVGAGNVIKNCLDLLMQSQTGYCKAISIGFAGSNNLPVGTVTKVRSSYRHLDGKVEFKDFRNGHEISPDGYDCYTSNNFVTKDSNKAPVLYDMELNYIVAFYRVELLGAIKIVSDNLNLTEYDKSINMSSPEIWNKVKDLVEEMAKSR